MLMCRVLRERAFSTGVPKEIGDVLVLPSRLRSAEPEHPCECLRHPHEMTPVLRRAAHSPAAIQRHDSGISGHRQPVVRIFFLRRVIDEDTA